MKIFVLFIIALCFTNNLSATPQMPDKIIYKGKEYKLLTFPLESYFKKHPDKRPKTKGMSTGLWRNYIATFEIKNNQLYVKDIKIRVFDSKSPGETYKSIISQVFPNQKSIKADWDSELLEVATGKYIEVEPLIYGKIDYENYLILEINRGNVLRALHLNYKELDEFKENQFRAFKKTEGYTKLVAKLKKHFTNNEIDSLIRFDIMEYTSTILSDNALDL